MIASDERDLAALAADIGLRHEVEVRTFAADLAAIDAVAVRTDYFAHYDALDCLFLIAGVSDPGDGIPIRADLIDRLIDVNFAAGVHLINAFLEDLGARPAGRLVGVGSVASVRARRNNSVYAASKLAIEFYFEAVRHGLARTPVRVQFYRLGYVATRMMAGRVAHLPVADPAAVARRIADRLDGPSGLWTLPAWWRWIMFGYRLLPRPIFDRLDV